MPTQVTSASEDSPKETLRLEGAKFECSEFTIIFLRSLLPIDAILANYLTKIILYFGIYF